MDEQAQRPPRDAATKIVIAIIAGAVIVAGAIVLVTRGPEECDEWNDDVVATFREFQALQEAPSGSVTPEEISDASSRGRQTLAARPDDCEISDAVQDEYNEMQERLQP